MSEERYRPMGTTYRSYSPAGGAPDLQGRRLPHQAGQFRFPRAGGHADTPGTSPTNPPSLLENPGGYNRRTVPNTREGQGQDKANRGRAAHVDPKQWGAHALYRFGSFVYNRFTSRMTVQAALIPRVSPQAGETRPGFATPPAALQGPVWRFTAVTDKEAYAEAAARAKARLAAARR